MLAQEEDDGARRGKKAKRLRFVDDMAAEDGGDEDDDDDEVRRERRLGLALGLGWRLKQGLDLGRVACVQDHPGPSWAYLYCRGALYSGCSHSAS